MTDRARKLLAVYLSTIMVFSVFGSVALTAPAMAATNSSGNVAIGNSPSVNVADATIDPSSDSKIPVAINVADEGVALSDIELRSYNETGTQELLNIQGNTSAGLSSLDDTGNVTIPVNTVVKDFPLNVTVFNSSSGNKITGAQGTSSITVNDNAPTISSVSLGESSGSMTITFASSDKLGSSSDDLSVSVTGANGKTYSFNRTDFEESDSYQYTLTTSQTYDDGEGSYTLSIDDAKDKGGNNGGNNGEGTEILDTYDYSLDSYINGTVTDADGATVTTGTVIVQDESRNRNTIGTDTIDSNGEYSVPVSSGTYTVLIDSNQEYEFELETGVSVASSSTKQVDFTLTPYPDDGTITGKIVDSSGEGVPTASVGARELSYRFNGVTQTNDGLEGGEVGEFSLTVPASNYTLRASKSGLPPKTIDRVTVREGETTDVGEIQLPQPGYISGQVTNASGAVSGVGVVADSGDGIVFDTTDNTGQYNITAPPGDYTVNVFTKGEAASSQQVTVNGGSTATADFTLKKTNVVHSSVEVISGSEGVDTENIGINTRLEAGMLQTKLVNQSGGGGGGGGPPDELEGLGVADSTEFRVNMTVTNFTANSLMWGIDDAEWSTSENETVTNGTDITVTGTPVQLEVKFGGKGVDNGVGPLMFKDPSQVNWATGKNDRATDGRNKTIYFGVFDLSNVPGTVRDNLNGMSVTTNAQRFSTPRVVNNSLRVWVAAPTKTTAGNDHSGFYQAEIPQAQLDEWGVSDPESELNALYKGDSTNFTVTDTADGARVRLDNISYSAGFAEVEATTSPSQSPGDGPSPDTGSAGAGQGGVGGAGPGNKVTTTQTDTGTEATIDQVTLDDPTVTVSTTGTSSGGVSVTEVSATFTKGTNSQSTMSVTASTSPPSGTPDPPNTDSVLSYVDVTVEGSLAKSMSEGRFTVDVSERNVDPAAVTAQRYDGSEWHDVETEPIGDSTVEVISPDGYSAFAVSASESAEPEQPTVTPTAVETDTPADTPTSAETPATADTPAETATATPTAGAAATPTTTPTPTATSGAFGPGFGLLAALLAIVAALGVLRFRPL